MSKKIAFLCDCFAFGGLERILVNVCNILADNGYDIFIIWTGFVDDNYLLKEISPNIRQFNAAKALSLEVSAKPKNSWFRRKIWKIRRKINMYKLRYLKKYINDFSEYEYLVDFRNGDCQLDKIITFPHQKKIVWLHGGKSILKKLNINSNIFKYDKMVCLTKGFERDFLKKYPKYEHKIVSIYNPNNIDYIQLKAKEFNSEITKYSPYFLCVSRLDNDKDIITILKACKIFYHNSTRRNKMIFLGNGINIQAYCDFVKQNNLEDKVFFLGNSDNPYPWMHNANALILSSRSEGLPTVLIEGQICNTLCISSNCPYGPQEILEDGKSGILFDIGDYRKLAQVMEDIENNVIDSSKLVQQAQNKITRFNTQNFVRSFNKYIINEEI